MAVQASAASILESGGQHFTEQRVPSFFGRLIFLCDVTRRCGSDCPISPLAASLDLGIEVRNGIGTGSRTTPSARCVNKNSRNQRNFNLLLAMILNLSCRCGRTR